MDLMVIGVMAILGLIGSALIARIRHKSRWQILGYAIFGLLAGSILGYFIAPVIISFL